MVNEYPSLFDLVTQNTGKGPKHQPSLLTKAMEEFESRPKSVGFSFLLTLQAVFGVSQWAWSLAGQQCNASLCRVLDQLYGVGSHHISA